MIILIPLMGGVTIPWYGILLSILIPMMIIGAIFMKAESDDWKDKHHDHWKDKYYD